jgi:hypothetical protein
MEQLESLRKSKANDEDCRVSRTRRAGNELDHTKTNINLNTIDEMIHNEKKLELSIKEKFK